jgi:NAD(P)-dependent dehydrogenase (short-subunit alcohol dehydrogenase family)
MARFDGQVALVSGAAGAIGGAVVARLTEEGARVVACDVDATGIDGGVTCDVRDADSCRAAVNVGLERHGQLDVLVNVAGIAAGNRIEDVTPDEWRRVIDVNLTGTFLLSQAAVPALRETGGTIVNLASAAGIQGTPYNASYCASKGGVIMLTKSLALELAADGVRVNAVCPASVDTPFLHGFQLPEDADLQLLTRSVSPMGGLITPAEVAAAVAYLASSDAASVSGTTLVIDGAASA